MAGSDTSKEADILADAEEAFNHATDAWSENYAEALDDFNFARLHKHWPEKIKKQREDDGRPSLTIPKLPAFIRQVVNDARQNKPGIVVAAADSVSDPETAEIINGLIRQIERASHADVAYDTGVDCAVTGGFGYFEINTRYSSDDGFEQDIVIEATPNPFCIVPDPDTTAADSSDWNLAFKVELSSKKAFEARWKGADAVSFDGRGTERKPVGGSDYVQTAIQWTREETTRKIVAVSPPSEGADPALAQAAMGLTGERLIMDLKVFEANRALFDAIGVKVLGSPRDVPTHKVAQRVLSGCDVLETVDWAGKYIPIIPVYGDDVNIEGRRYFSGLIRAAKDEQRRFNYEISAATEASGLAPKTPFIGPVGAFVTDAAKWATANTDNHAYIEYDLVGPNGEPIPAPVRQGYAGVPVAQMQLALNASDNMKSIMGLHDASLGQQSNETSGRAILARQREGDVSSFHFIDNLSRAVRHAGEVILDLIPKVYSTPRVIRVLGPEGKDAKPVQINQPFKQPVLDKQGQPQMEVVNENGVDVERLKEIEKIFRLDVGKYDLTVKAGPSFTTQREEFVALATEIMRAFPASAPILADLIIRNYDLPDADEVVERLKALLPAQLQGESPEAQQMKAQIAKLGEMLGQAKAQIQSLTADREIDAAQVKIDGYNAETQRLKAVIPKGTTFDPAQMGALVAQSLAQILRSPDILELASSGASPEQIMAAMAQQAQGGGQGQPPPAQAA